MGKVDDILAAIDAGLQTPVVDPTHGEVSPVNDPRCWRCQFAPPLAGSESGLCHYCRGLLLGETPVIPPEGRVRVSSDAFVRPIVELGVPPDIGISAASLMRLAEILDDFAGALGAHVDAVGRAIGALAPLAEALAPLAEAMRLPEQEADDDG